MNNEQQRAAPAVKESLTVAEPVEVPIVPDPKDYSTLPELYVNGWNDCRAATLSPTPPAAGPAADWEAMYDQMCERCDYLDKKLAEYEAQQDADKVEAQPSILADEDIVRVPRGLIGAACSAIDKKRDAPNVLAKLRRYTTGDLSRNSDCNAQPDPAMAGDEISDEEIISVMAEFAMAHETEVGIARYTKFDIVDGVRALLKRVQPASGEDARAAAPEISQLRQALKDCQTVAIIRGDQFLPDCIDNTGQVYQSAHLAALLEKS